MNWDQLQGKWKQMRGSVRERWGKLTDDDFDVIAGNRDKFIGIVQERYGMAKEDAQKKADEWLTSLHEAQHAQEAKRDAEQKTRTAGQKLPE
jgi:uncharacterized protein YjbJ (UPF0337 family)